MRSRVQFCIPSFRDLITWWHDSLFGNGHISTELTCSLFSSARREYINHNINRLSLRIFWPFGKWRSEKKSLFEFTWIDLYNMEVKDHHFNLKVSRTGRFYCLWIRVSRETKLKHKIKWVWKTVCNILLIFFVGGDIHPSQGRGSLRLDSLLHRRNTMKCRLWRYVG